MDHLSHFAFINRLFQAGPAATDPVLDPVGIIVQIGVIILGFIFSAFFSGSEVAFFTLANQPDQLAENEDEDQRDPLIQQMLDRPRRLLATILIGNTFANIVISVFAAVLTGNLVLYLGFPEILVFVIEVIVLTFMILVLSEITPKVIAMNDALRVSRRLSKPLYLFYSLLSPFSRMIANSTLRIEERLPKPNNTMTSEDIMTMAEVSEQEGSIKSDEREIIENVIEFGTTTVKEIMTSRLDVVAVSTMDSLDEVLSLIREKGISRMPLYETDLDNILGIIHSKDVLPYIKSDIERTTINWRTIARKALFIPSTKKLDDLLRDFQQEKTHIAMVVDEYGGTEGLITLDDILEEIVGDIADESSETEERLYRKFRSGVYIFDARMALDDMEEILDCQLTSDDDDFETLGGLVYHLTERIPTVGERIYFRNIQFTIHSVLNNRVRKLRVKVLDDDQQTSRKTPEQE